MGQYVLVHAGCAIEVEWDQSSLSGKLLHMPDRTDVPENIKEQLIVELYSK